MPNSREEEITSASQFLASTIKELEEQIIDLNAARGPAGTTAKSARISTVIHNHNGHKERLSLALRSVEFDSFNMGELQAIKPAIDDYVKHGRHYGTGHIENYAMYERLFTWRKEDHDKEKRAGEKKQKQQPQKKPSWDLSKAQASDESKSLTIWALEAMVETLAKCISQLAPQPEKSKRERFAKMIGRRRQSEDCDHDLLDIEFGASPPELLESLTKLKANVALVRDKAKRLRPG
ncbi:hypothetical protein HJFPF1_12621 [Paramyrothecium foliicola]|nr:hypothetical protein HJFPF1_12621 [Paramyrothecium foliicola]